MCVCVYIYVYMYADFKSITTHPKFCPGGP